MNKTAIISFISGILMTAWGFYLIYGRNVDKSLEDIVFAAVVMLAGTLILIGAKIYLFIQITRQRQQSEQTITDQG